MSEFIRGTCNSMCPAKEALMREREGLLHKFEIDERTKGWKRPIADPTKVVKCFGRSAAGQNMTDPEQLRPGPILLATVKYLFTEIAPRTDVDWVVTYEFIFDRLRSVRQDLVIQRSDSTTSIQILECIVRFLVYASQRLCERKINEFDPKLNNQDLSGCMKHLLTLYDQEDKEEEDDLELDAYMRKLSLNNNRRHTEALNILLNMGDAETLQRALNLPARLRESPEIQLATKISLAWYLKNYVRACTLIRQLSPIFICAFASNLQSLRRTALKRMSLAYNSKVLTYPAIKLKELLLYKDISNVRADCELFGLTFTDENIVFEKANFNESVALANSEMYYTPQALHDLLPSILLEFT